VGGQGSPCGQYIGGNAKEIHTHLHNPHDVDGQTKDLIWCKWTTCTDECRYGSIPQHIVTLKVTFHCLTCQQSFSRGDCVQQCLRVSDEYANSIHCSWYSWTGGTMQS